MTPEKIIEIVADYFHVDKDMLRVKNRNAEFVKPRHIAMYLCKYNTELSFREIGKSFNKDHASVIHAIKSVENQIETNRKYREVFDEIELHVIQEEYKEKIYSEIVKSEVYQENDFYQT